MTESTPKKRRGFAVMNPAKVKEIASAGGKTAHARGRANKFEKGSEAARAAGKKGGLACHEMKRRQTSLLDRLEQVEETTPVDESATAP